MQNNLIHLSFFSASEFKSLCNNFTSKSNFSYIANVCHNYAKGGSFYYQPVLQMSILLSVGVLPLNPTAVALRGHWSLCLFEILVYTTMFDLVTSQAVAESPSSTSSGQQTQGCFLTWTQCTMDFF